MWFFFFNSFLLKKGSSYAVLFKRSVYLLFFTTINEYLSHILTLISSKQICIVSFSLWWCVHHSLSISTHYFFWRYSDRFYVRTFLLTGIGFRKLDQQLTYRLKDLDVITKLTWILRYLGVSLNLIECGLHFNLLCIQYKLQLKFTFFRITISWEILVYMAIRYKANEREKREKYYI